MCLISRGLTTPRPDVMTIATATTPTLARYGRNVPTTRRTVCALIGRLSSSLSGDAANIRAWRPMQGSIRTVQANAGGRARAALPFAGGQGHGRRTTLDRRKDRLSGAVRLPRRIGT